jgi:hypothetical protein
MKKIRVVELAALLWFVFGCSGMQANDGRFGNAQVPQARGTQMTNVSVPAPVFNQATSPLYVQLIIEKVKGPMVAYVGSSPGPGPDGKVYHNKQVIEFWDPQFNKSDLSKEEREYLLKKGIKFGQNFYRGEGAGQAVGVVAFELNGPDGAMIRQIYMKWAEKYGKSFPGKEGKWVNTKTSTAIVTSGLTVDGWKATRVLVNGLWYLPSVPEQ